jgi:hypothetical protein
MEEDIQEEHPKSILGPMSGSESGESENNSDDRMEPDNIPQLAVNPVTKPLEVNTSLVNTSLPVTNTNMVNTIIPTTGNIPTGITTTNIELSVPPTKATEISAQ